MILIAGLILILAGLFTSCSKEDDASRAPDFTLQTLDGMTVTLSNLRGKPVMLTFWSIDCPACVSQIPFLNGFYDAGKSRIELVTINAGDNPLAVKDFVIAHEIKFPVLLDRWKKTAQAYGIPGVPVTFFIDTQGIIKAYKLGAFQSQNELEVGLDTMYPSLIGAPTTKKEGK